MYSGCGSRFVLALHMLYNNRYVTYVAQKYCLFLIWQNNRMHFLLKKCILWWNWL